jgi:hypothetical protein
MRRSCTRALTRARPHETETGGVPGPAIPILVVGRDGKRTTAVPPRAES